MWETLKNRIQYLGLLLLGIGFVYQTATPFFLSVGSVTLGISALFPPYSWHKNGLAVLLISLWLFNFASGLWSEDIPAWSKIIMRQLALVLIPLAMLSGFVLKPNQWKSIHLTWIGLSALFALISLFRYFIHKEAIDLSLIESGAIPIWDGISAPWKLEAISSSKFSNSGVNHIYFSIVQAIALLYCGFAWVDGRKSIWLLLGIIHLVCIHWFLARTGIVALYFAGALIFLRFAVQTSNRKWLWIIGIGVLSLPFISYFSFDAVQNKVKNSMADLQAMSGQRSINHRSLAMRVEAWKTAWHLIQKNPFGVGAGDVDHAMAKQYEEDRTRLWMENRIPPHNQYIETALSAGILPALILLGALMGGILLYWRQKNVLRMAVFACLLISLCFESILQTQLGICLFPFILLFVRIPQEKEMHQSKALV